MRPSLILLSTTAFLLDTASAHGFVTGVSINGKWTKGSDPIWYYSPNNRPLTAGWDALNQDIGFVEPAAAQTADVNCHKSATAGKLYADVNPGDTINFSWNTWPVSHKGPIINYIAPCNGTYPPLFLAISLLIPLPLPSSSISQPPCPPPLILTPRKRRLRLPPLHLPPLAKILPIRHPQPRKLGNRRAHLLKLHHLHRTPSQPRSRKLRDPPRDHRAAQRGE